ncbi:MAG: hypothetical protein IT443_05365 [Phycisphaeraceae bacterium]|nr:hypothetical protein [Phycisphaeraceae bacterium]
MWSFIREHKWLVGTVLFVFFFWGFGLFRLLPVPQRYSSSTVYYCSQCGIYNYVHAEGNLNAPADIRKEHLVHNELSRWYFEHIDPNCRHTVWQPKSSTSVNFASLAGYRLWDNVRKSATHTIPRLLPFGESEKEMLETLLKESPEACKQYIRDNLKDSLHP